jgi:hypothetical protein
MPLTNRERPLKVCGTCRFWSIKYKGFCQRLGQGVGRFWLCADWTAEGGDREASPERKAAPAPPLPST